MRDDRGLPVLWHLEPSHFNEKARWTLDYKGVPHRRIAVVPGRHVLLALALTRRTTTLPVMRLDGKMIGDSTRIIAALEERAPDPPLYPRDPAERARALALEDFLDTGLGPDARRVVFNEFMPFIGSRAMRVVVRRRFGVDADSAAKALVRIEATMGLLDDLLAGGDHLVGDRFTVADLTASSLLAPLVGPPELPYRLPDTALPAGLQQIRRDLRALPAGEWVLRTYERFRPASAEVPQPVPA